MIRRDSGILSRRRILVGISNPILKRGAMANIKIPEGMLKAVRIARDGVYHGNVGDFLKYLLEAALQWLADNPIVPTDKDVMDLQKLWEFRHPGEFVTYEEASKNIAVEWQRRMFLAPEEDDSPISDLLYELPMSGGYADPWTRPPVDIINTKLREAYRRGKGSK